MTKQKALVRELEEGALSVPDLRYAPCDKVHTVYKSQAHGASRRRTRLSIQSPTRYTS